MPFGPYKDFDACVGDNKDKSSPEGYCASIHKKVTGEWPGEVKKASPELLKAWDEEFIHSVGLKPGTLSKAIQFVIKGKQI
jgi:bacillopeptidase F (M6 metalloprotease family)